jgi:hypothetical protein
MQGLASLLESTGLPKTIERMSYGEPLTNIGRANVPLLKPETAEAMMTVAPMAGPVARGAGRLVGSQINRAMLGEGGLLAPITPQPMRMFVGETSNTWNKEAAKVATQMEKAGASPKDIYQQTGTFRGAEGKLRQEISDAKSMSGEKLYSWGEATDLQRGNSAIVRRQKALLHPELSAAYPDTKNIIVSLKPNRTGGYYEMGSDNIGVPVIGENNAADRSLMLHELQHAIQQREGFAGGANPNEPYPAGVRDQIIKDQFEKLKALNKYDPSNPYSSPNVMSDEDLLKIAIRNTDEMGGVGRTDAYRRSAGEAEARLTQARMNLTPEQRLQYFPLEQKSVENPYGLDVNPNELIVRQGLLSP